MPRGGIQFAPVRANSRIVGVRGLACLAVLLFHGLWWYTPASATGIQGWLRYATSGGYRGVNLFFVLSGLLITNILLEARDKPEYFARFYKRRALRILPAYYMLLALLPFFGVFVCVVHRLMRQRRPFGRY